jgi:hypothetical protein
MKNAVSSATMHVSLMQIGYYAINDLVNALSMT